jgi:hypothetical protein
MDVIHKKANLILLLRDGYTGSTNLKGVIRVKTERGITAVNKGNGYFVFVDLAPGHYMIQVESSMYGNRSFPADIQDCVQIRYLTLQPGKRYPLMSQAIRIAGKLKNTVYALFEGGETVSILGEYEKGEQNLKLIFSESEPVFGREFYISEGDTYGIYRIVTGETENMCYTFDRPLDFAVRPTTEIFSACEICPEDGNYFLAVKGNYRAVSFLEKTKGKQFRLELQPDIREYKFDIMMEE